MPTYQYICKNCNHELEELQSITEPPLVVCPKCGKETLARVMGSGSGLIFKGSGFYLTDYAKKDNSKSSTSSTKPAEKKADDKTSSPSTENKPTSSGSKEKKP